MTFIKEVVKAGVIYGVATAASTVGLLAGMVIGTQAMPVIEEKSKKFFSKFKKEEEEES